MGNFWGIQSQTRKFNFTLKNPHPPVKRKGAVQKPLVDRAFNLKVDKFEWFAGDKTVPFFLSNPTTYQAGSSNQIIVVQALGQIIETNSPISMSPTRLAISGRSTSRVPDVDVLVTLNPKEIPPASCTGTASVTVTIKVTRKGTTFPVPNFNFALIAKGVDNSGGDELIDQTASPTKKAHPEPRPVGTFSQNIATTTHEGLFTLAYTPSYFGGSETISVLTTGSQTFLGMATLTVRVPDLMLLPASTTYHKVGGTATHTGPPLFATDNNHWGKKELVQAIFNLVASYSQKFPLGPKLSFNDMSLPNGGKFDVFGDWVTYTKPITTNNPTGENPHRTHKEGLEVDFRTHFLGVEPNNPDHAGKRDFLWRAIKEIFNSFPLEEGWNVNPKKRGNWHWHLTIRKKRG